MPTHRHTAAAAAGVNWLALMMVHAGLSSCGLYAQLHASKEGQASLSELEALMERSFSGAELDLEQAKRMGGQLVRAASATHLGAFCAANLAAVAWLGVGLATKAAFLGGGLTATEHQQLTNRLLRFVLIKILCGCSGVVADLAQWLGWCLAMGYFQLFIQFAALRGDALLASPSATLGQHGRILLLLGGILAQDCSWIAGYARSLGGGSWSHACLYLFDALLVACDATLALAKYGCHAAEHWRHAAAEARGEEVEPWALRPPLVYWLDLASDVSLQGLTLAHSLHVWWLHGLQAHLVDGMLFIECRWLAASLAQRLSDHARCRRLRGRLDATFADAGAADLSDERCPICLAGMQVGKAKLLPCSHVAHTSCLAAWLQQCSGGQGQCSAATCPLCRASLDAKPAEQQQEGADAAAAEPGHQPQAKASAPSAAADAGGGAATPAAAAAPAPSRRVTRLQARLSAAQARGAAAAAAPAAEAGRQRAGSRRRRIDGILDA